MGYRFQFLSGQRTVDRLAEDVPFAPGLGVYEAVIGGLEREALRLNLGTKHADAADIPAGGYRRTPRPRWCPPRRAWLWVLPR